MSRPTCVTAALFAVAVVVLQPFFGATAGTSPAGPGYDTVNRCYALVLVLLSLLLTGLARRVRGAAAWTCAAAAGVAAAGVALEFWGGLLQDRPLSEDAHRRGLPASAVWWGSDAGFWLFGAAAVVLAVATVVAAVRGARRGALRTATAVALGATGPLVVVDFALTGYGSLAAAAGGVATAVPWLAAVLRDGDRAPAVPAGADAVLG